MALSLDLLFVLLFSVLGGVLATRFRQPSVLGVLIAGAIVGPNALGLIQNKDVMSIAIEIGAILLLFLVGIEFSVKKLFNMGLRAVLIAIIKLGIVFFIGYFTALLFGLGSLKALFIGVLLSVTSTVIFLKILEQKGMIYRSEVSLLVAVLIIEDIFGVFALTFFSSLSSNSELTPWIIIIKLILSLSLIAMVYFALLRVSGPTISWLSRYSTDDTITFIAIGLCAGMAYIAYLIGLSAAVGAFLAGNIVSSLKNAEKFEKAIHPFILTFTSLFFFSIGTIVDFTAIISNIGLVIVLLAGSMLFKFLATGFSMYLLSDTDGRGAIFSGLAMISLGEFSLLIAQEGNKMALGIDFVSITAIIIFLSSLAMSLSVTKITPVYNIINHLLPKGIRYDMSAASSYLRALSLGNIFTNLTKKKISLEWRSIYSNLIGILFIAFVLIVWYHVTQFRLIAKILDNTNTTWIVLTLIALVFLFPTFNVIRNLRNLIIDVFKSYIRLYPTEIANEKKVFRNVIFAIILFVASLLVPLIVSLFGVSRRWNSVSIALLILLMFDLMKSGSILDKIIKRNKDSFEKYSRVYGRIKRKRFYP